MDLNVRKLLRKTRNLKSASKQGRRRPLLVVVDEGKADTQTDFDTSVQPIELAHQILRNEYAISLSGRLCHLRISYETAESSSKSSGLPEAALIATRTHTEASSSG